MISISYLEHPIDDHLSHERLELRLERSEVERRRHVPGGGSVIIIMIIIKIITSEKR